jgi:hypothetical protein
VKKHKQVFLCQKVESWVDKQLEVFTSNQYGANWESTRIIMDNFEEYKLQYAMQMAVRFVALISEAVSCAIILSPGVLKLQNIRKKSMCMR